MEAAQAKPSLEGETFQPASSIHQHVIFGEENARFATKAMLHHHDLLGVLGEIVSDTDHKTWSQGMKLNVIRTRAEWAIWRAVGGPEPSSSEAAVPTNQEQSS